MLNGLFHVHGHLDLIAETGVDLTPEAKRKILGLNAAKLYGIDVEAQKAKIGAG